MCFKRKKNKVIIDSRYKVGESVRFHYKGNLRNGSIHDVRLSEDGRVLYDITLGGECPATVYNIRESEVLK